MNNEKKQWEITVAKSGVLYVEAVSKEEALKVLSESVLTNLIQWEDAWNILDIEDTCE